MSNIAFGWDNNAPGPNDQAGLGDDQMRSIRSNVQGVLDAEHHFPSTGGNGGAHRLGSARAYVGTLSQVSSADTDGRLMVASNASALFHVGSSGTLKLGSSNALILDTGGSLVPGNLPVTHQWMLGVQSVINTALSAGSVAGTFDSAYSGKPFVWLPPIVDGSPILPIAAANTASACTVYFYDLSGALVPGASQVATMFSLGSRLIR